MEEAARIIQITKDWIAQFVIQYNLCPFAKRPFVQDKIKYIAFEGEDLESLAMILQQELLALTAKDRTAVETSIIIVPNTLLNFRDYLDFLELANRLIFALRLEGVVQIASFHPDYQFANTAFAEVSNFTNRSPFPLIHLLREDSISEALENYETPESIPERNRILMHQLRKEGKI